MIQEIARQIALRGARAFYAGGFVRDQLLNVSDHDSKDIDIEVFLLEPGVLRDILSNFGEVKEVGKSYPVFKISGYPHFDFTVAPPGSSYEKAALRRDFTVNAMMIDVISGDLIDPCQGVKDLHLRTIRHTQPRVFIDDPLRVYRAVQLAARLNFSISPETQKLMAETALTNIDPERILLEIAKMLLRAEHPSIGLRYLEQTGVLERNHPELYCLKACIQSPTHHPEGDVWEHTLLVVDQAARLRKKSRDPQTLMWAALLHDIGKPGVTRQEGEKVTAYGHDTQGAELARRFLRNLRASRSLTDRVTVLVREHMRPVLLYKEREKLSDKAIRKLVERVNVAELLLLSEADYCGRTLKRDYAPIRTWLLERIARLGLDPESGINPLVQGRDLLALGFEPGPALGDVLKEAYEMQLEGKSKEEILKDLKKPLEQT